MKDQQNQKDQRDRGPRDVPGRLVTAQGPIWILVQRSDTIEGVWRAEQRREQGGS